MTQEIFHLNLYSIIGLIFSVSACMMLAYAAGYQRGVDDTKNDFTNPFNKKRHG
jgi:hypothetical protein